jgi:hypothetical protein
MEQSFCPNEIAAFSRNLNQVVFVSQLFELGTFKLVDNIFRISTVEFLIME